VPAETDTVADNNESRNLEMGCIEDALALLLPLSSSDNQVETLNTYLQNIHNLAFMIAETMTARGEFSSLKDALHSIFYKDDFAQKKAGFVNQFIFIHLWFTAFDYFVVRRYHRESQ
jgi:hypothetical protein